MAEADTVEATVSMKSTYSNDYSLDCKILIQYSHHSKYQLLIKYAGGGGGFGRGGGFGK